MKGVVNSIAYAGGLRLGEVPIPDISEVLKQPGRFVWIGLHEPDAEVLAEVQQEFALHDLAIEDATRALPPTAPDSTNVRVPAPAPPVHGEESQF